MLYASLAPPPSSGGQIDPTSPILATGSTSALRLADRFGAPTADVRGFMPNSATIWGASTASRPLSNFFASLAAAQAVYPFATALTQEVDWCALQLAHDTLYAAGGGEIVMPPGTPKANFTLVIKADKISGLRGAGQATTIDGSGCCDAGVPVIRVTGQYGTGPGYSPGNFEDKLANFAIRGKNIGSNPYGLTANSTPGQAATGFVVGSVAITTDNLFSFRYRNISISFFDKTTTFGNNCWSGEFIWCTLFNNNYGACFAQLPTRYNSGENMRWIGGNFSNNNYNIWVDCTTSDGGVLGGSFTVNGASCDYPYVQMVVYDGGSGNSGYSPNDLTLTELHMESTGSVSGQAAPVLFRNGPLTLRGCKLQWSDGLPPRSIVTSDRNIDSQTGSVVFDDVKQFGMLVPLAASPAGSNQGISFKVEAFGNRTQSNDIIPMFMNSDGKKPQHVCLTAISNDIIAPDGGSITVVLEQLKQTVGVRGSGNIVLPVGVFQNFAWIEFMTLDTNTNTFVSDGTSSIAPPSGKTATFGGVSGARVRAIYVYGTWRLAGSDLH